MYLHSEKSKSPSLLSLSFSFSLTSRHRGLLLAASTGGADDRHEHVQHVADRLSNTVEQRDVRHESAHVRGAGRRRRQLCAGHGDELGGARQAGDLAGEEELMLFEK